MNSTTTTTVAKPFLIFVVSFSGGDPCPFEQRECRRAQCGACSGVLSAPQSHLFGF